MKGLRVLIVVAVALALQTTVARVAIAGTSAVDLVLVAVVYAALTIGPVGGMLSGSVAGLIQDVLSSGVLGIGGLSKSIVGFLAGLIGQQFIITATLPRLVMIVAATALHAGVFMGLYTALGLRTFDAPWTAIGAQAGGNVVVGIVMFAIAEALPAVLERRGANRRARR